MELFIKGINKPRLNYIEHDIVSHCNLNCNGCTHFSPLANPWFEDIDDFRNDFTQLSRLFNINTIRIMGGEPLLHPEVGEFLIIARQLFPISRINLVTNGILLQQNKELIKIINENKIIISITDYGILDIKKQLIGIDKYIITNRNEMYNISFDLYGQQDAVFTRFHCPATHCTYIQNGKVYVCASAAKINIFNTCFNKHIPESDGISIYEHTAKEIQQYLDGVDKLCCYCNVKKQQQTYHPFTQSEKNIQEWIEHDNNNI